VGGSQRGGRQAGGGDVGVDLFDVAAGDLVQRYAADHRADVEPVPLTGCVTGVAFHALFAASHPIGEVVVDRKLGEGKTRRAHKRHLANRVIRRMWKDESRRRQHAINVAA
jgi:hypothetical protein